jgi:hypothetical protein
MYRQGLGDCFLLTFPGEGRDVHVLVDCGVLIGTPEGKDRVCAVAENVKQETHGRLDVLVVTHEHWDHVSGFVQAQEVLAELRVGEVWVAWTEDPHDDLARKLARRREHALRGLVAASGSLQQATSLSGRRTARRVDELLRFFGGVGAAKDRTTAGAMRWAKARARPRYLQPGEAPVAIAGTGAVRVFVLGPPRDPKALRRSDPSKRDSEVYELAAEGGAELGFLAAVEGAASGTWKAPFEPWFAVPAAEARERPFFREGYWAAGGEWQQIEDDWLGAAGPLALDLDSDTNNTSLVLAFELVPSGRVLLFPGDAQVGSWLSWEPLTWQVAQASGAAGPVTSRQLLARTVLYKVGHHGSHNATLREKGLELMTSGELVAMIPVERAVAKKQDPPWKMPFRSLHLRLKERTRGRILDRDEGAPRDPEHAKDDAEWQAFLARTDVQPGWMDFRVDV